MTGDDAQVSVDTLREDVSGDAVLVTVAAADVRAVLARLAELEAVRTLRVEDQNLAIVAALRTASLVRDGLAHDITIQGAVEHALLVLADRVADLEAASLVSEDGEPMVWVGVDYRDDDHRNPTFGPCATHDEVDEGMGDYHEDIVVKVPVTVWTEACSRRAVARALAERSEVCTTEWGVRYPGGRVQEWGHNKEGARLRATWTVLPGELVSRTSSPWTPVSS